MILPQSIMRKTITLLISVSDGALEDFIYACKKRYKVNKILEQTNFPTKFIREKQYFVYQGILMGGCRHPEFLVKIDTKHNIVGDKLKMTYMLQLACKIDTNIIWLEQMRKTTNRLIIDSDRAPGGLHRCEQINTKRVYCCPILV